MTLLVFLLDSTFVFGFDAPGLSGGWNVTVSALLSAHFMWLQSQKSVRLCPSYYILVGSRSSLDLIGCQRDV